MMAKCFRLLGMAVLIALLCLPLAGCGDDGDGSAVRPGPEDPDAPIDTVLASLKLDAMGAVVVGEQRAVVVRAYSNSDRPIGKVPVAFSTNFGSFSKDDPDVKTGEAVTDHLGVARIMLTAPEQVGEARISVTSAGISGEGELRVIAGDPDRDFSRIVVDPASLPADGKSEGRVTVVLADKFGNPVQDGTRVELYMSSGDLLTPTGGIAGPGYTQETVSGRTVFRVQAADSPGFAELMLTNYRDIDKAELIFGSLGSGEPSSIRYGLSLDEIAVTGVGQVDNTGVNLRIIDEAGSPAGTPDGHRLRASFLARPNGGEFLSTIISTPTGKEMIDSRANGFIEFTSDKNGAATINLRSGTRSGIVEILIEALDATYRVKTVVRVSIASGPPHSITLSAPFLDAIEDLKTGFYSKKGSLMVNDRYGNPVPDGTVINIGVLDTVISRGAKGKITEGSRDFSVSDVNPSVDLRTDYVVRNNYRRYIEDGDRVIIANAPAEDKVRTVRTVLDSQRLETTEAYKHTAPTADPLEVPFIEEPEYVIGASTMAIVEGLMADGTYTKGTVVTNRGRGEIRLVYPANSGTIQIGHQHRHWGRFNIDETPHSTTPYAGELLPHGVDLRYDENLTRHMDYVSTGRTVDNRKASTMVYFVASSSDNKATLVADSPMRFNSIAPWTIGARPDKFSSAESVDMDVTLTVRDGGDKILLPYVYVFPTVEINGAVNVWATPCITDASGTCNSTIRVIVPAGIVVNRAHTATITYETHQGYQTEKTSVTYTFPRQD
ncbi:hypothetical protein LZ24_01056 [Desulfobotulus alkaliphilus]|uniref:Big-1 domain-containing protein n=1 Tax=Desulfobotulus alkaliphilus TaxID=622671 RepID=A0A562S0L0_9BACT|nr:Ig-like domain-containing protein [Desulfobotulus alkaliphilus]TWI74116.1 hypothetical protein LZ24_01056 [Desulfobotulus alkaliphilus]